MILIHFHGSFYLEWPEVRRRGSLNYRLPQSAKVFMEANECGDIPEAPDHTKGTLANSKMTLLENRFQNSQNHL
jgi:hypothetical protein